MAPKLRALVVLVFILAVPLPAYAYLDPQTGAMVLSAVVAFFATVAMGVQAYWYKLVSFVRRTLGRKDGSSRADDEPRQG
jgi:hypothetical protein